MSNQIVLENIQATPLSISEVKNNFNIGDLLADFLVSRGFSSLEEISLYLDPSIDKLYSPWEMKDMDKALELILKIQKTGGKARVLGDYDADGVTSTVILVKFLNELGIETDYYIPHRIDEGYGISEQSLSSLIDDKISLALTVDCGISNFDEISFLTSHGVETIVLDHHEPPEKVPLAGAVVNPKQKDCPYKFKQLAGVGVVFKLIQAVSEKLNLPWPEKYLPIVAIGTVADIMPLTDENRILIKAGLTLFDNLEQDWPGLHVLCKKCCYGKITPKEIAFSIAPKMNAAGRMGHAKQAVELLLADNKEDSQDLLKDLLELNKIRQKTEGKIRNEIIFSLSSRPETSKAKVMVIDGPWHSGVIGITAAKLSDLFSIPVFVIATSGENARGSARGVDGYDIHAILDRNKDLLEDFGGHYGAGGFSIKTEKIPALRERIKDLERGSLTSNLTSKYDFEASFKALSLNDVKELELTEPHGEANPTPVLYFRGVKIESCYVVGKQGHLKMKLSQYGSTQNAIFFKKSDLMDSINSEEFLYDITAYPKVETYNGNTYVCLEIKSIIMPEKVETAEDCPAILDSRNVRNRVSYIKKVAMESESVTVLVSNLSQKKTLDILLCTPEFQELNLSCIPSISIFNNIDTALSCSDIILFSLPETIEHFNSSIYKDVKRIHLLSVKEDFIANSKLEKLCNNDFSALKEEILSLI